MLISGRSAAYSTALNFSKGKSGLFVDLLVDLLGVRTASVPGDRIVLFPSKVLADFLCGKEKPGLSEYGWSSS